MRVPLTSPGRSGCPMTQGPTSHACAWERGHQQSSGRGLAWAGPELRAVWNHFTPPGRPGRLGSHTWALDPSSAVRALSEERARPLP